MPNFIKKVNIKPTAPFKQIENISSYLTSCVKLGVDESNLFDTLDLLEGKGMLKVIYIILNISLYVLELEFQGIRINKILLLPL